MLLSGTSGHEYDWMGEDLLKWRLSRGEIPWSGKTVEEKSAIPLTFQPGTSWAYSGAADWAGRAIELAFGTTLEEFMREHIWRKLGIEDDDISFFTERKEEMKSRMASFSTLTESGEGPAVDDETFDMLRGGEGSCCFGGAGVYCTPKAYYTFLSTVFRRDGRLLKDESYDELFRPQLDEHLAGVFNEYLYKSPAHEQF